MEIRNAMRLDSRASHVGDDNVASVRGKWRGGSAGVSQDKHGEYIDVTLGAAFGISTMAAAALGNLISDVGGLGSAHYVETLAARVGVRNPHLSPEQVEMRRTKWASNLGKFIGVTVGCLLGMFPLLFFNDKKCEEKEEEESPKAADEKGEKLTKKESEARPV
ncbi:hypothetical protein RRG08_013284 [Elysia crispata]|uniref:Transmembrane protein 65 n=1 Tax=Elysia crispata TaxID=231223 RepID=A0AAE1AXK2_9GAST|nr:hypothetical protein RRG08_013284 [Elysia crispata]